MMDSALKIIECPRDAMQGLTDFISTDVKAKYINQLLKVGFDTIDFGSFVSPQAIPQMRDTAEVLNKLDLESTTSKLLAIIANERGAQDAASFSEIDYLGYPFSVSETFQLRNTNATLEQSLSRLESINTIAQKSNKKLVVYLSMGFGNPYGDEWNPEVVIKWSEKLNNLFGIDILALSDTIGVADESTITHLVETLIPALPKVEFGAHLHARPDNYESKVRSAYNAGCRRFDGAIKGLGGCPMAMDDLTGNMPTEGIIGWFEDNNIKTNINMDEFGKALAMSSSVFPIH
jgi:hydroxymethylglutaryl-CoA lyase